VSNLQNEIILEQLYEHFLQCGYSEIKAAKLAKLEFERMDNPNE